MDVDFDFSDVEQFFESGEAEILAGMMEEGEAFVKDAKATGSYTDRSGHLRRSNGYEVDKDGLTLKNDAEYASFVESRDYEVAGSAALRTVERLKDRFE